MLALSLECVELSRISLANVRISEIFEVNFCGRVPEVIWWRALSSHITPVAHVIHSRDDEVEFFTTNLQELR
jgi:hypothetical protein